MTTPTLLRIASVALLLSPGALSQSPAPAKLDRLLSELQQASGETWKARDAAVKAAIDEARAATKKLHQQAKQREQAASEQALAAKGVKAELKKLEQLRGLVAGLRKRPRFFTNRLGMSVQSCGGDSNNGVGCLRILFAKPNLRVGSPPPPLAPGGVLKLSMLP